MRQFWIKSTIPTHSLTDHPSFQWKLGIPSHHTETDSAKGYGDECIKTQKEHVEHIWNTLNLKKNRDFSVQAIA